MALLKLLKATLSTFAVYGLGKLLQWLFRSFTSPLRVLPGPPSSSLIYGNLKEIRKAETAFQHEAWVQQYGKVMRYNGFLGGNSLFTMDTKAINHIFTHSMDYQKPETTRYNLSRMVGTGVLVTEGEKHRQQRRVMNPSFGPASIKNLTPIFFQKSLQLRDIWKEEIENENNLTKTNSGKNIEVLSWLSRMTLDVIGLAGFGYRFDALNVNEEPNELNKAVATLFNAEGAFSALRTLQLHFPVFRIIPTSRTKEEHNAQTTMRQIGKGLLHERKMGVESYVNAEKEGRNRWGKDLLSSLVRANMDKELPDSQRMVDEDVLAQVPTFLVAGHETTSTETMWALFALAQRPDIQSRLRTELKSVKTDMPSADDLSVEHLPFLDAVVRETLRVHAAVTATTRVAMKDDIIPVSEPYFDKYGNRCDGIRIRKGDGVYIPILAMNRSKEIWGEDAAEFNPDRWNSVPEAAHQIPGVWGNLMTFLGGARSCIGYRFALFEMKALLFTLLRTFEFGLVLPVDAFEKRSMVVTRPYVRGEAKKGAQMPLSVKLCDS